MKQNKTKVIQPKEKGPYIKELPTGSQCDAPVAGCWGDDQGGQHGVTLTVPVWLPLRGRLHKPDALHPKRHGGHGTAHCSRPGPVGIT